MISVIERGAANPRKSKTIKIAAKMAHNERYNNGRGPEKCLFSVFFSFVFHFMPSRILGTDCMRLLTRLYNRAPNENKILNDKSLRDYGKKWKTHFTWCRRSVCIMCLCALCEKLIVNAEQNRHSHTHSDLYIIAHVYGHNRHIYIWNCTHTIPSLTLWMKTKNKKRKPATAYTQHT